MKRAIYIIFSGSFLLSVGVYFYSTDSQYFSIANSENVSLSKKKIYKSKYNPQRKRNLFSPTSIKPYKLSRSKIDSYLKCPRCFYLDRRCGVTPPGSYAYTLNNAVDVLLKKEFDQYRIKNKQHPLCVKYEVDAVPFSHPNLNDWRMFQRGIQYLHKPSNFLVTGAIDDIWVKPNGKLIIVDYKATSIKGEVSLENRGYYKTQMEIYQWLFMKNGFPVSRTGYFVYCNGNKERDSLDGKLEFKITLLPYNGDTSWVEDVLLEIKDCLMSDIIPESSESCGYCKYRNAVKSHIT